MSTVRDDVERDPSLMTVSDKIRRAAIDETEVEELEADEKEADGKEAYLPSENESEVADSESPRMKVAENGELKGRQAFNYMFSNLVQETKT